MPNDHDNDQTYLPGPLNFTAAFPTVKSNLTMVIFINNENFHQCDVMILMHSYMMMMMMMMMTMTLQAMQLVLVRDKALMGKKMAPPLVPGPVHHSDCGHDDYHQNYDYIDYDESDDDRANSTITRRGSVRSIVRVTEMSELLLSSSMMTHFHSFD